MSRYEQKSALYLAAMGTLNARNDGDGQTQRGRAGRLWRHRDPLNVREDLESSQTLSDEVRQRLIAPDGSHQSEFNSHLCEACAAEFFPR